MSPNRIERHPLSQRHFRQIVCRAPALQKKMRSVWAVTWRPGDNTSSFLGKSFRPLGGAVMMVQASYAREKGRDGIGLLGLSAVVEPQTAVIDYSDLRLRHDFHRVPYVGARGPVLDPGDDHRGNASWVELALNVDRIRARVADRRHRLSTVPDLPQMFFGYSRKEQAQFEVTTALRRRALHTLPVSWSSDSLHGLQQRHEDTFAKRENDFAALSPETQQERLQAAWDSAFIPPTDDGNSTGLWLLPFEFSTKVYGITRVFEFFGELTGAAVYNPARDLDAKAIPNPAVDVARTAKVDLIADLQRLAQTGEQSPEFFEIEQRVIQLVPAYRRRVKASAAVSDQDLLCALCDYKNPVLVQPALESLPEPERINAMRSKLKPNISECCTDADILSAARCPNGSLIAAGLCRVQTLFRDARVSLAASLEFSSQSLGRERMEATLWHDAWVTVDKERRREAEPAMAA